MASAAFMSSSKVRGGFHAALLHEVHAADAHEHRAAFPGEAVGLAGLVEVGQLRALHEVVGVPAGGRELAVGREVAQVGQQARRHPARGQDEGDVAEVP
jgi:hypothetical protein